MVGYDEEKAVAFIVKHLKKKDFPRLWPEIPGMLLEFIRADQRYMLEQGVLDADGYAGEEEYDPDEAMETIYQEWLENHPDQQDEDLEVAQLLDAYQEWNDAYLERVGLA